MMDTQIELIKLQAIRNYFKQQDFQMPAVWAMPYIHWQPVLEQDEGEMRFQVEHVEVEDMLAAWNMYCKLTPLDTVRGVVLEEWLAREGLSHIPVSFAMRFARWAYAKAYVLLEVGQEWMLRSWRLNQQMKEETNVNPT